MPSATFNAVVARVLDDLFRDDLTSQATTALQAAVRHYESKPWWPKEQRSTASTVAGQEFYALPTGFQKIDTLRINVNSSEYKLFPRTWEQIDAWQDTTTAYTGRPTDFCIYDKQIRLYPIPDAVYTLSIGYSVRLTELVLGSGGNEWTDSAEELIRRRAEADLAFSILRDTEAFQVFKSLERDAERAIVREHTLRVMTGRGRKRK